MTMRYRAHGLVIDSEIPLDARLDVGSTQPSLRIQQVHGLDDPGDDAEVILSYDHGDGATVAAHRDPSGVVHIEVANVARFQLSADADRLLAEALDPDQLDLARILTQGWVMATTLMLRGQVVLHASSVTLQDSCIAFLGDSGMGKSTVTALLVRDGAKLVSDDLLVVSERNGVIEVEPGTDAIRLRDGAGDLVGSLAEAGHDVTITGDGRSLVRFTDPASGPRRLDAVLIPVPDRQAGHAEVRWLDPGVATFELNQYPRVFDWHIDGPTRRHFECSASIAASVPVGVVVVPWGPPWPVDVLPTITDALASR